VSVPIAELTEPAAGAPSRARTALTRGPRLYALLAAAGLLLGALSLAIPSTPSYDPWSWLVWGVFVRIDGGYHITWIVNSAAHRFGYRTYRTSDQSTNCWWVGLLTWGEGWHNNHHAHPTSARHGLKWYEIDFNWWGIRLLQLLELAGRQTPPCIVVDLAFPGLVLSDLFRRLGEVCHPSPRVVAYGSHIDADSLHAARLAGCDPVLPRSKFVEELPRALPEWLVPGLPRTNP